MNKYIIALCTVVAIIYYDCMYGWMDRHHLREVNTFKLKLVKYLVFDEADRLFEMGVLCLHLCFCTILMNLLYIFDA